MKAICSKIMNYMFVILYLKWALLRYRPRWSPIVLKA